MSILKTSNFSDLVHKLKKRRKEDIFRKYEKCHQEFGQEMFPEDLFQKILGDLT